MQRKLSKDKCEIPIYPVYYDEEEIQFSKRVSRRSRESYLSQIHTQLFDINENSKSSQKSIASLMSGMDRISFSTNLEDSSNVFWDQSSICDVKLLLISTSSTGIRKVDKIIINTEKYSYDSIKEPEDIFDIF
ncbi:Hypothetical_protein [Hexamita inflata]|uniref:Hypothetical_protein n=1 Tax=Hexamita inflata TaxID=28002 RepID=A0AA86RZP4_9EUKA|nr:Hypothetical protein HINF_LOCUS63085 [Hexamita inflata]